MTNPKKEKKVQKVQKEKKEKKEKKVQKEKNKKKEKKEKKIQKEKKEKVDVCGVQGGAHAKSQGFRRREAMRIARQGQSGLDTDLVPPPEERLYGEFEELGNFGTRPASLAGSDPNEQILDNLSKTYQIPNRNYTKELPLHTSSSGSNASNASLAGYIPQSGATSSATSLTGRTVQERVGYQDTMQSPPYYGQMSQMPRMYQMPHGPRMPQMPNYTHHMMGSPPYYGLSQVSRMPNYTHHMMPLSYQQMPNINPYFMNQMRAYAPKFKGNTSVFSPDGTITNDVYYTLPGVPPRGGSKKKVKYVKYKTKEILGKKRQIYRKKDKKSKKDYIKYKKDYITVNEYMKLAKKKKSKKN